MFSHNIPSCLCDVIREASCSINCGHRLITYAYFRRIYLGENLSGFFSCFAILCLRISHDGFSKLLNAGNKNAINVTPCVRILAKLMSTKHVHANCRCRISKRISDTLVTWIPSFAGSPCALHLTKADARINQSRLFARD